MSDIFIPLIIFGSVVAIVKIITDTRTKRMLIERGLVDDRVRQLLEAQNELSTLSNIKWGIVLVSIGVAILISRMLDGRWWENEGLAALIFIFGGAAFLAYYVMANNRLKEIERRQHNQPGQ